MLHYLSNEHYANEYSEAGAITVNTTEPERIDAAIKDILTEVESKLRDPNLGRVHLTMISNNKENEIGILNANIQSLGDRQILSRESSEIHMLSSTHAEILFNQMHQSIGITCMENGDEFGENISITLGEHFHLETDSITLHKRGPEDDA